MLQIHERIKSERVKAGLTEDELAERVGVRRSTYQYWEKKTPSVDKVKRVAGALGLPDNYFFSINDEKIVSRSTFSDEVKKPAESQPLPAGITEALAIIKQQNEFLQRLMESNLAALSRDVNNNASAIRAEIRGYGKYQLLKQVDWDDKEFAKAMAVVDKIYGEELHVDDGQGN